MFQRLSRSAAAVYEEGAGCLILYHKYSEEGYARAQQNEMANQKLLSHACKLMLVVESNEGLRLLAYTL